MIVDLCPYWVYPVTGGGPVRVYNLNMTISEDIPIKQYSFRPTSIMKSSGLNIYKSQLIKFSDNYCENRISNPFILASSLMAYKLSFPQDTFMSLFANTISKKVFHCEKTPEFIQIEHPWLFQFAKKRFKESYLVSCSHNYETSFLKKQDDFLANYIRKIEKQSLEDADIIFSVSQKDIENFHRLLKISKRNDIFEIPNGVNCNKITRITSEKRNEAKKILNLVNKKIILFTGSIHKPNQEAINFIENEIAPQLDDKNIIFLVVGSVGTNRNNKKNVIYSGYHENIDIFLHAADIAINPLISGSGTSLKMLEYMALGLPVISTPTGARGLDLIHPEECILTEIDEFDKWISILFNDSELYNHISNNARSCVENRFDWKIIAKKIVRIYQQY